MPLQQKLICIGYYRQQILDEEKKELCLTKHVRARLFTHCKEDMATTVKKRNGPNWSWSWKRNEKWKRYTTRSISIKLVTKLKYIHKVN